MVAAVICLAAGFVGCLVPYVPGPLIAFGGLMLLLPTVHAPSVTVSVAFGVAAVVASFADGLLPLFGVRRLRLAKWGLVGCLFGTAAGAFVMPMGLVLGPLAGAFLGELASGRGMFVTNRREFVAFVGCVFGLMLRLGTCLAMAVWVVRQVKGI